MCSVIMRSGRVIARAIGIGRIPVIIMVVAFGTAPAAMATLRVEANYSANEDLNLAPGGVSTDGTITGTDPASAPGDGFLYLPQPATPPGNNGVRYGGDGASKYFNVTDGVSWGTNTIVGKFRPDTTNTEENKTGSRTFASVGTASSTSGNGLRMQSDEDGTVGPRLELFGDGIGARLDMGGIGDLVAGREYLIAGSWRDNGDDTLDMSLSLRSVDGSDLGYHGYIGGGGFVGDRFTTHADRTSPGTPGTHDWLNQFLHVGRDSRVYTNPSVPIFNFEGRIDLFQIYDTYFETQEEFDALFATVPEPSGAGLLGLGLFAIARRRRS